MTTSVAAPRGRISLTQQIFIGLGVGILIGAIINNVDPTWSNYARPFSQLFLRMIKMIIAPLIFATLVAGIAGAGHVGAALVHFMACVGFDVVAIDDRASLCNRERLPEATALRKIQVLCPQNAA